MLAVLIFLPLSVWSQLKDNYRVRSESSFKSDTLSNTSTGQCYPTGIKEGVMIQVLCKPNGKIVMGWVSRKALDDSVTPQTKEIISTRSTPPTGVIRSVEPRLSQARVTPKLGGEHVDDFMSLILKRSPKRIQEKRVVHRKTKRRDFVDLVQLPTYPDPSGQGVQMACGSQHIRNDRSPPYATALTSCLITAVAQEWRQKFCPDNNPDCRLMIGDGSHGARIPSTWPHSTHRDGNCFDIWPIRKSGGGLKEVDDYNDPDYSRERTAELVKLLHNWGSDKPGGGKDIGNQIFFNDARLKAEGKRLTRTIKNHDGHIHVCFRDNEANRKRCDAARFDTKLCPGLAEPKSQSEIMAEDQDEGRPSTRSQF